MRSTRRISYRLLAFAMLAVACAPTATRGQSTVPKAASVPLPEPVYWSQQLFLIPYKWDSGSMATNATAVKLYLSQDRGQTWNEIASAKPEVQFFNYHAPSDGEYWFSMRTIDSAGRAWPEGPHQAELRVMVDTQNPTVTTFNAKLRADGAASVVWQATDPNINTSAAKLQYRTPADSQWQNVPSGSLRTPTVGFVQGDATWQVPVGTSHMWVRLTVRDLAGNGREAGAEARIEADASAQLASSPPTYYSQRVPSASPMHNTPAATASTGWTAASAPVTNPYAMQAPGNFASSVSGGYSLAPQESQAWPSDGESLVPLGTPRRTDSNQLTAPSLTAGPAAGLTSNVSNATQGTASRSSSDAFPSPFQLPSSTSSLPSMRTASARPFDNAAPPVSSPAAAMPSWNALPSLPPASGESAVGMTGAPNDIQHLNSLDFEIGYDIDAAGTFGVTRVELWGTSDGGQSWRRLSVDNDNRSPILAAVPAPGDYGLKIVVETAGGIDPVRPRPGDRPEMLVRIDTTPPVAKLTGVSQGTGANADQLMVEWQPSDNYQSGETVSLYYSSHATGPWVSATASLPNDGHYAWRLARHLPSRLYLKIEVRDPAGNVAVDQTQVPVEISLPTPSGRLGSVRAVQ